MNIAVSISICLKRKGKKQKDLAAHLGIRETTLSQYMNAKQHPKSIVIHQMAKYFEIRTSAFIALGESSDD